MLNNVFIRIWIHYSPTTAIASQTHRPRVVTDTRYVATVKRSARLLVVTRCSGPSGRPPRCRRRARAVGEQVSGGRRPAVIAGSGPRPAGSDRSGGEKAVTPRCRRVRSYVQTDGLWVARRYDTCRNRFRPQSDP